MYTTIQKFLTGNDSFNLLTETANDENAQDSDYLINSSYKDLISRFSFLFSPFYSSSEPLDDEPLLNESMSSSSSSSELFATSGGT